MKHKTRWFLPVLLFLISPLSADEELKNDDGTPRWCYLNKSPDYLAYYGARFSLQGAIKIRRAKVYSYLLAGTGIECTLYVHNDDGGLPGVARCTITYIASHNTWDVIPMVSPIPYDSDFWVVIRIPEQTASDKASVLTDDHMDHSDRNAVRKIGGTWTCAAGLRGDICIRAIVSYDFAAPGAPIGLTADGSSPSPWKNTSFSIDWTNPYDSSGIAGAWYKLDSPSAHSEDGMYTVSKPFNVNATVEGGQELYVWLQDSIENKDHNNRSSVSLRYETVPPTGSVASSADTSATTAFIVSWSSGNDAGGSGLSGSYDVRIRVNAGGWNNWRLNYPSLCDTHTGFHGYTYDFEAGARDSAGNVETFIGIPETSTLVDTLEVGTEALTLPCTFHLSRARPNPFRDRTVVRYALPTDAHVEITVYDLAGQEVRVLVNERRTAGYHTTTWRGSDRYGKTRANGTYFIRMQSNEYLMTRKLYLVN